MRFRPERSKRCHARLARPQPVGGKPVPEPVFHVDGEAAVGCPRADPKRWPPRYAASDDQALVIGYGDKLLIGVFGDRDLAVTGPGRIAV
jgi:hypothetical protein